VMNTDDVLYLPVLVMYISYDFVSFLYFFFFQAEDGIRDWSVTGVQRVLFRSKWPAACARRHCAPRSRSGWLCPNQCCAQFRCRRSEERRVGKEWRCRWGEESGEKEAE